MVPLIIDVIPARRGGLSAGAHSGRGVPLPQGRRSRGKAEGARRIPGRADIFFIVVHPPQKVKELCRLWRNSLFLSKERGKTGGYMGFLTEGGGALRGETTKFPQKKSKKMPRARKTRNRPLFGSEEKTKKGQSEDCPFCYGFIRRTYAFFSAIAACAAARRAIGTRNGEQDT